MLLSPGTGHDRPRSLGWREWHLPLAAGSVTLREGLSSLRGLGEQQAAIPLVVQWLENPRYRMPLVTLFPGAVDLGQHDCIHLVLGRGLLPMDEAFAIGFTMGSTRRIAEWRARLFCWLAEHLYPPQYRFGDRGRRVFLDAVRLAQISDCRALDRVDFQPMMDWTLASVREELAIDAGLLRAYYAMERSRNPELAESRRLLDGPFLQMVETATRHPGQS